MTSVREVPESSKKPVLRVTPADVAAARLKIVTSRRLGKPVPDWVKKVAAAAPQNR